MRSRITNRPNEDNLPACFGPTPLRAEIEVPKLNEVIVSALTNLTISQTFNHTASLVVNMVTICKFTIYRRFENFIKPFNNLIFTIIFYFNIYKLKTK